MGCGDLMRLWRLSDARHAAAFDGGYGLLHEGRWNVIGRPVTYAATSPALSLLEKLVHVEDPDLLPPMILVAYDIPDETPHDRLTVASLPADWQRHETLTQTFGDTWLAGAATALLYVPSAIVPVTDAPDENVLINHRHPATAAISISRQEPFAVDLRLLR